MSKGQIASTVGALVIGILGSLLAQTLWTVPFIYSAVAIALVCFTAAGILFLRKHVVRLKQVGIVGIHTEDGQKIRLNDICGSVSCSFDFLGICAFRTVLDDSFRRLLDKSRLHEDVQFRFLLLDPASSELPIKARDEGENPESLRHEVEATLTRLIQYKRTYNVRLDVRLYDSLPIWRMLFLNDEVLYLNQFLSGSKGTDSPQVILRRNSPDSLYASFRKTFEHAWSRAKVYG